MNMKELYLNTLRDCLTGKSYNDGCLPRRWMRKLASMIGAKLGREVTQDERDQGRVWPMHAATMIGTKRMDNFRWCIETVIRENIPGDIVECGVWRGGASIYAAGVLVANQSTRKLYVCDSFQGLPKPKLADDRKSPCKFWKESDALAVSKEQVWSNFCRFHLGVDNVELVQGWFNQTLKTLPCKQIAVLRADGDMYESTRDILAIADRVQAGGFVIIDDYGAVPECKNAVDEYLAKNPQRIVTIDYSGIYWRVGKL